MLWVAIVVPASAQDWPQFRGPDGQGHAASAAPPLTWNETTNVVWKVPVAGRAWSSPVVIGGLVWVTTALETEASAEQRARAEQRAKVPVPGTHLAGQVTLKAVSFDVRTGRIRQEVLLFDVSEPVFLNPMNSYASPTPVAEPGRLYCDFGAMGTACLDTKTGKILWKSRLVVEHQVGPGSSPILYRDLLILVRDGCDQQYVAALEKDTGRLVWKTRRPPIRATDGMFRKAFSTPLVFSHDGRDQMVVPGAQWIVSYDPATGRELWRVDTGGTFSNVSRPVYGNGLVYICTAFGGTRMLAIRPDGRGDVTKSHVAWELRRATPRRSSPLLVNNRLYFVSDNGVASCVDAETGRVIWNKRLGSRHSASPVFAADRVYFFGEEGTTTVVAPADSYRQLASNPLNGRIMATPAFVGRSIFLRTATHLYRLQADSVEAMRPTQRPPSGDSSQ
ncbi:MAG: PQQ-binding-like beta-propeller repeat protein [Planctomycetes bacterium]|nr:PQQ-binding-like beta-propeller repeat protein [Planctomycetota bacterium]